LLAKGTSHQGIFPKSYDLVLIMKKSESLKSTRKPAC